MATRNLVPRISGEGGIGKVDKAWATGVFDNLYFGGVLLEGFDQNVKTSDSVEFLSGNFVSGLTINGIDVSGMDGDVDVLSGSIDSLIADVATISGSLADLEETADVETLSGSLDSLTADVATISASLADLEETPDIETLSGSLDSLTADVSTISGSLADLEETADVEALSGSLDSLTADVATISASLADTSSTTESVLSGAAEFLFFSNVTDNDGITEKTYYPTPDPNLHLSGVTVASASNLRVELKWDGPNYDYIGEAFIEGQKIPIDNIEQLDSNTRRFVGYLDNLDLEGKSTISGEANGRSVTIPLVELGSGPESLDIRISPISTATPKPGQLLGSTHLKQGDTINIEADFNTSDVDLIKVFNSGISQGIDFASYSLSEQNGIFTATIPIEISNRNGSHFVSIQAINSFGSTGDATISTGSINLDQAYPSISITEPTNYNGRSDGLREGETTTFSNSVSNFDENSDFIEYRELDSSISISNKNTLESPKQVSYQAGIFNNSDNAEIYVFRTGNGATDTEALTVKIANSPEITGALIASTASTAVSPSILGSSEVKAGDEVEAKVYIDGKGSSINDISVSVSNKDLSDGTQQSFSSSYSKTTLSDGSFEFTIPVKVFGPLGNGSRDGQQGASFKARNNFNSQGDEFSSQPLANLNNGTIPQIQFNSVSYPAGQQAIKSSESATVDNSVSNFDSISYSSPNGELSISNPNTFEQSKNADYLNGGYNVDVDGGVDNLKISATKTSNGATIESSSIVNIANSPLILSVNNLASKLPSSVSGESDQFNLSSSQVMLNAPTLGVDPSQSPPSSLSQNNSGTSKNGNSYTINIAESDQKGTFSWQVSARNLANISTTTISTNPTYTLAGFSERIIQASPNSIGAGLASIGTTVSNTSNLNFENISEGGSAPNGGTIYSYEPIANGTQLDNSFDLNNKFTTCNSTGSADSNGDHVFNLDKMNRSANTSTSNPASFVISES